MKSIQQTAEVWLYDCDNYATVCAIIRAVHSQSQPYVRYIVVWTLILDTQAIEVLAMCSWRMASK